MAKNGSNRSGSSYGAKDITVLEGLEAVRKRPGMYLGSTGARGLHHLIYEVMDNSVDEALAGECDHVVIEIHPDNTVTVTTTPNVTHATVLLDSRLINYAKQVTLAVNGKTSVHRLVPCLRTLCDTLQRRGDPDRAFTSEITLPL